MAKPAKFLKFFVDLGGKGGVLNAYLCLMNGFIINMMTAIAVSIVPGTSGHLRPLNVLRDLPAVADLIELCFHSTMDSDGRQYLQNIRRSANDTGFLRWAQRVADSASLPLSGYVWDDGGKIVGNVSLIPYHQRNRRLYLIANVATHPDYRRRGIARLLTDMAMRHAREKHADRLWLQVRDDNPGAIKLYEELGFVERFRRSSWYCHLSNVPDLLPQHQIARRNNQIWPEQSRWLERLYPRGLYWYYHPHWDTLGPGLWNVLGNFVKDTTIDQWSLINNAVVQCIVAVQRTYGRMDNLWAAIPPTGGDQALSAALIHARRFVGPGRYLHFDFPAYESKAAIEAAGFHLHRTLIWMEAPGAQPKR